MGDGRVKPEYRKWIDEHYPTQESAYGKCDEATLAMQKEFPHLRRVRGFYYCIVWGERTHWWLQDGDDIVDPTAIQFPSSGGPYDEVTDESQIPTGVCMDCGSPVYNFDTFCSRACEEETRRYLMTGVL